METGFFPKEVTGTVPLITLTGAEEVRVEQHRGLLSYQLDKVVFRTAAGLLTISGSTLRFSRYSAMEATLTGHISGIEMEETAGGGKQ